MDRRAAHLDGDDRVEDPDGSLEGLEVAVLVREHAEAALVDAETDSGVDVLLRRLEPRIALGLSVPSVRHDHKRKEEGRDERTCLKM